MLKCYIGELMAEVLIDNVRAIYEVRGKNAVLLCAPHPLFGGSMYDIRLERISKELTRKNFSVLRFDYSKPYRGGSGEVEDAKKCLAYLKSRHDFVGVAGYSFGSLVASNVAEYSSAACYISPLPSIDLIEFADVKVPKLFVVAIKDQVVSQKVTLELYERSSDPKEMIKLDTDHFYFGKFDVLAKTVADFFLRQSQ